MLFSAGDAVQMEVDAPLQPKLFVYRMVHDDGAAPCHENGLTTLAICKAEIRNAAQIGDVIMGIVSNRLAKASATTDLITVEENSIVYIATVESTMSMEEYNSPRSKFSNRADAIYDFSSGKAVQKANPYHDHTNVASDLRAGVLILKDVKRCIGPVSAGRTLLPAELAKKVSRSHLTVKPGHSDYAAFMQIANKTPAVADPVYIGSSDKARQKRYCPTAHRSCRMCAVQRRSGA
eukprot:COSAG02_NODE_20718_length_818_cov_0.746871_1_plen_235_part_00